MKREKSRYFTFLLYPDSIPEDWEMRLELLGVPMAISPLHDKDLSTVEGQKYKKPHYHVIYVAKNPVTANSVRNKLKKVLGNQSVALVQIVVRGIENMYLYLTHESVDAIAKNKTIYDKKDIKLINNFDIDRYVILDEYEKKDLRNLLIELICKYNIVNALDLIYFLRMRGSEFGITNMKVVNDILSASCGLFRLFFDANYQNGFRARYAKRINEHTGEIIN